MSVVPRPILLMGQSVAIPRRHLIPCRLCGRSSTKDVLRHLDTDLCMLGSAARIMAARGYVRLGATWALIRKAGIPTIDSPVAKGMYGGKFGPWSYASYAPEWAVIAAEQFAWPVRQRVQWLRGLLRGEPDPVAFLAGYDALRRLGATELERQKYVATSLGGGA